MCCGDVTVPDAPSTDTPSSIDLSNEMQDLVKGELQLQGFNLGDIARQREEQEATRTAFEKSTGKPYSQYLADTATQQAQLQKAYMDRVNRALSGTEPVSPALEQQLTEQEKQLEEQYLKQIGPGFRTSTPWQQGKKQFDITAGTLRENAKEQALGLGASAGYASPYATTPQITAVNQMADPTQTGSLFDLYKFNTAMKNNAAMAGYQANVGASLASQQNTNSLISGGMNLAGNLGTTFALGSMMGLF